MMAEFRGRLRVASHEVDGNLELTEALAKVKGLGVNLSDSIATRAAAELGIPRTEKIGNLSEDQVEAVEEIIKNPVQHGVPIWMINRRKDRDTGANIHLVEGDLGFAVKQDKEFEINIHSYRGNRHMRGLRVRGQRTRTTGRKGRTLGVQTKKEAPKTAPGKAGDKK